MSSGTPTKAASSPSGEVCTGSRIMEQTPTDRATNSELGGWFRGASEDRLLELRPGWQSRAEECAPPPAPRPRAHRDAIGRSMPPSRSLQRLARGLCRRRAARAQKAGGLGIWAGEGPPSPRPLSGLWPLAGSVNKARPGTPHSRPPPRPGVWAPQKLALGPCFSLSE